MYSKFHKTYSSSTVKFVNYVQILLLIKIRFLVKNYSQCAKEPRYNSIALSCNSIAWRFVVFCVYKFAMCAFKWSMQTQQILNLIWEILWIKYSLSWEYLVNKLSPITRWGQIYCEQFIVSWNLLQTNWVQVFTQFKIHKVIIAYYTCLTYPKTIVWFLVLSILWPFSRFEFIIFNFFVNNCTTFYTRFIYGTTLRKPSNNLCNKICEITSGTLMLPECVKMQSIFRL